MKTPAAKGYALRLFLLSFLILYIELIFIRWLSSYVLYLGYFTNFVLLGAFLGIGAGVLLSKRETKLIDWVPVLIFLLISIILLTGAQVNPAMEGTIYFTNTLGAIKLPATVLLPIIFIGTTVVFTALSQELGILLEQFEPLRAYGLNISGSLAGIASFTLLSFFSLPAWVWFLIAALFLVPFLSRTRKLLPINLILLLGLVSITIISDIRFNNIWSPYYRLNLHEITDGNGASSAEQPNQQVLSANGIGHQSFANYQSSEPFYRLPYTVFEEPPAYQNVLVIGAGGGNDVMVALRNNVGHIDAVEIDPRIIDLGKEYHPEKPYQDPRVTIYTDDARAFLKKTDRKYDLIIFALPDSLVLATSAGSLRLESYLFTTEAFKSVKEHLEPDGMFVLYNYYRQDWLIDKINSMLFDVFGEWPLNHQYPMPVYELNAFATIFIGPKAKEIDPNQPGFIPTVKERFEPATDDWPFLYIKEPSLPALYGITLIIILAFSLGYVLILSPKGTINTKSIPFFFLGAAFSLLETKSIVQFLLYFGATWIVNSLVFFAILVVVLIANWIASKIHVTRPWILYALLLVALIVNFTVPVKLLLVENLIVQYLLVSVFLFSPIFIANLIFSTMFKETQDAPGSFGLNLLGTMVGGVTEYLSLYFGYQNLIIFAAIFYLLAFFLFTRTKLQPRTI
jgi:spermidine synthase